METKKQELVTDYHFHISFYWCAWPHCLTKASLQKGLQALKNAHDWDTGLSEVGISGWDELGDWD